MAYLERIIPIYTTRGDVGAVLDYPYLYNPVGEWIGWVCEDRQVYSVHGNYVGLLSRDWRILRKRTYDYSQPDRETPTRPVPIRPPAHFPLPPMMAELALNMIDILDEMPEMLPSVDYGDLRQDMD
jgi:hypothetical protein